MYPFRQPPCPIVLDRRWPFQKQRPDANLPVPQVQCRTQLILNDQFSIQTQPFGCGLPRQVSATW